MPDLPQQPEAQDQQAFLPQQAPQVPAQPIQPIQAPKPAMARPRLPQAQVKPLTEPEAPELTPPSPVQKPTGSSGSGQGTTAPVDWQAQLGPVGAKYGINPELLQRLIKEESGGHPNALSPKGAQGLMQLMPATAQRYGVDANDPVQSLDAGAQELKRLLEKYEPRGRVQAYYRALAAYNAGEGVVD